MPACERRRPLRMLLGGIKRLALAGVPDVYSRWLQSQVTMPDKENPHGREKILEEPEESQELTRSLTVALKKK
jgi:hypothetical protein